ncbi:hypothetical protein GCM10010358_13320 [Streptomyces minutiscleroticus]|uniref:DUF4015 domain-containing protein n=1 Tax=Streptomyces minutiscleroticus TaxID=68238 RepID=A0A918KEF7_9ACTN|nr:hypothetical protein GCM10010358_13320 [Streptomyces minutiscleroticus]
MAVVAVVVACTALGAFGVQSYSHGIRIEGLGGDAVLDRADMADLRLTVAGKEGADLDRVRVTLDGKPVRTRPAGGRLAVRVPELTEGEHELAVRADTVLPFARDTKKKFTVDTVAPRLRLSDARVERFGAPVTVRGRVEDAGRVKVTVAGKPVSVADDGSFSRRLERSPGSIAVTATDAGGHVTSENVNVSMPYPVTRAAHLSAIGWTSPALRDPILELARKKRINAVQLDIKDELGEVGYASEVPMAREIGAVKGHYDARKVIDQLHGMGVRVVGRIVAFRDPILAEASHRAGKDRRLVQDPSGEPYNGGSYGKLSFTNFADPEVRKYNSDLAAEAAKLGFDDILYDYVRRPDGDLAGLRFPGLGEKAPEESIAEFVAETRDRVRAEGAFLGASVYGIAATRPTEIAQDIPALAESADYIAPMVYPSHWAAGEYGVTSPNSSPYDIVHRSLADFAKQVKGTNSAVVPWLQDFSMGTHYGPEQVSAQIKAAADNGMNSFLLWNAGAKYQGAALPAMK